MNQLPKELFKQNGFLRDEVQEILHEVFGFDKIGLSQTRYIAGSFKFGAITYFKKIIFDTSFYTSMDLQKWFVLIVHEQVHREDIIQNPLKGVGFYISYFLHWLKAGFSYRGNKYEQKAYGIEAKATELWKYKENALKNILKQNNVENSIQDIAFQFNNREIQKTHNNR